MLDTKTKRGGNFDIVANINRLVPEGIEFHTIDQGDDGRIRKSSFTGPNSNLNRRLEGYNPGTGEFISVVTDPINKLDKAAMEHDLAYSKYKDLKNRHRADEILIKVAEEVLNDSNSTRVQKFNAGLVKTILTGKIKLGIGLGGTYGEGLSSTEQLIREAQRTASTGGLKAGAPAGAKAVGVLAPLALLAASVGIPAVIALIGKKKKDEGKF